MFGVAVLTHFNKVGIKRGAHLGYSYCSALLGQGFNKKHKVNYLYFKVWNNMDCFTIYIAFKKKCLNSYLFLVE